LIGRAEGVSMVEAREGGAATCIQVQVYPDAFDARTYFVKPPWSSTFEGAEVSAAQHLLRQKLPVGGTAPVGLKGWGDMKLAWNGPPVAHFSTFVDKFNDLLAIDLVGLQPGDSLLEARRGDTVLAYMLVSVTPTPAARGVYVDNFV